MAWYKWCIQWVNYTNITRDSCHYGQHWDADGLEPIRYQGICNNHTPLERSVSLVIWGCKFAQILIPEKYIHKMITLLSQGYFFPLFRLHLINNEMHTELIFLSAMTVLRPPCVVMVWQHGEIDHYKAYVTRQISDNYSVSAVIWTSITACISNCIHHKVWHELTYPFPNFNGADAEVWEWKSNSIPHSTGHMINHPCWY